MESSSGSVLHYIVCIVLLPVSLGVPSASCRWGRKRLRCTIGAVSTSVESRRIRKSELCENFFRAMVLTWASRSPMQPPRLSDMR